MKYNIWDDVRLVKDGRKVQIAECSHRAGYFIVEIQKWVDEDELELIKGEEVDTTTSLQHYNVRVECKNCGYFGDMSFKKGISILESRCPFCDVPSTLTRHYKPVRM